MDKEEAERLVRAIRKVPVDWIQVQGIEFNSATGIYELKCAYRQARKGLFHQESWTTLWIKALGNGLISSRNTVTISSPHEPISM